MSLPVSDCNHIHLQVQLLTHFPFLVGELVLSGLIMWSALAMKVD